MSYEAGLITTPQEILFNKSTPDYSDTPVQIVDLYSATPSASGNFPYAI
jgi:hypothetical protein